MLELTESVILKYRVFLGYLLRLHAEVDSSPTSYMSSPNVNMQGDLDY